MNNKNNASKWRGLWLALLFFSLIIGATALIQQNTNTGPENPEGPDGKDDYFFVVMAQQAETTAAREMDDLAARQDWVYQRLTRLATRTQADLRALLDAEGVAYTPLYLVNGLEVKGDAELRAQIAERADVARVLDSPHFTDDARIDDNSFYPAVDASAPFDAPPSGIEESLNAINAPQVWDEMGITGEGIVVASADTGVDWTHSRIREQYAGSEDNHNYTWFDPWWGSTEPTDWNGHGTHTTGTMLGADGIGVAPDAQWIGCMNLGVNYGNAPAYIACMEFLFAPFPLGGNSFTDGDPARGAHIVNNSWGCPSIEGCDQQTLSIAVSHLENAGQLYVVSAGNSGPGCSTIGNPAFAPTVISVGAVNNARSLAGFSSRGPVMLEDGTLLKPDVVAPGVNVLSSVPGEQYRKASGTSMAGPHVAGVAALVWSANADLIGDIEATRDILLHTASPIDLDRVSCGVDGSPNNLYGMGMIDAYAAVARALDR